ncbi:hypothetical protein G7Z17_g4943 [Cylindrodendrum hubeiense]|uniref:Nephrocystin 3-like N-terminal domain-containing protein n=1 Tax=Cylindrodendrum hubeiense TaxID=595255 RepID=A0A9P5LIC7_9HYPO|nr:hypothetical protein G7Z17_g4943 [Cylindrodendrum hubeiense]
MIDPIGLIGTLIAIVQVCNKVVSVCYEYHSAVKDAPHDIARILNEVASVRNIAERLIRIAEVGKTASIESVDGPNSPLHQYLSELVDLKKSLKLEKKKGLRSTLLWPLRQVDVEKKLIVIGRIKATFQLALTADNAYNIVEVLNNTRSLPLIKEGVAKINEHIKQQAEADDLRNEVLQWFSDDDQSPKHHDAYKKCVEGTGDWLLQNDTYVDWKAGSGKLLWLNGNAGCGKTVLCANVIENLEIDLVENERIGLVYFYIDGSGQKSLDIERLYRSMISQLIHKARSIPDAFQYYGNYFRNRGKSRRRFSMRVWETIFQESIQLFDSVYIVMDALDESEESMGAQGIMDFIADIFKKLRDRVHIIAFSRDLEGLRTRFREMRALSITVSGQELDHDLKTALQTQLSRHPKFSRWPKSLKRTIEESLLTKANGSNQLSVLNTLRWVAFAYRPISLNDIAIAIAMNDEDADVPFFDEHLELLDVDGFMDSCSSLVSTYCAKVEEDGSQEVYVKLAHFSHKEASGQDWTSEAPESLLLDLFDENQPYFNKWMELANIDKPWLEENDEYSSDHSPLYCAAYSGLSHVVKALLDRGAPSSDRGGVYGHSLQAASFKGHLEISKALIDAEVDVNAKSGTYGSALAAASAKGHIEVAKALVAAGASLDGTNRLSNHQNTPLFLAASHGHLEIVELLLEHGAKDMFRMKSTPGSALHAAAISGRLDIVKSMLKHEQIRSANGNRCHAVVRPHTSGLAASQYSAAAVGHIDLLRELLKYGIEKEETLRYAARAGDKALVVEMLDQGISIDAPPSVSDHAAALQSAARGSHVAIVQELISRGADLNDDSGYSSPLLSAIRGGNVEILQMIIDAGADLNPNYPHPIDNAALDSREDMVEILVKHGADLHKAVRRAAIRGDSSSFQLLLKLGGDIRVQQPHDHTCILQAAARGGSEFIVRYLLDNGMEVEPKLSGHTTPFTEAIRSEHWKVAELLLDTGANVNAPLPAYMDSPAPEGVSYYNGHTWPPAPARETPLTTAIAQQNPDIACRMMNLGASVTPNTPETAGTPLLYAVWEGYSDLVSDLIGRGADVNQRGMVLKREKPTFPLLLAIERGNVDIVNKLINAGAKIDDQDIEGFSPMHVAAANKNAEFLSILIRDHHANISTTLLNGSQPIHSAASRGTAEHVKILLDSGASIDCKNNDGRTPLHWAADGSCWDSVELLLGRGADASVKVESDESGPITALDLAHLAREKPDWQKRDDIVEAWDGERVDKLLQRLKLAMMA